MSESFRDSLLSSGAVIDGASSTPLHFGNPEGELDAALEGCVVADACRLARLRATGPDALDLLQRLSTGDVKGIAQGEGRPTILTTPKGRIVERLVVHNLGEEGLLLIGGPDSGPAIAEHLQRFTFREDIGLADAADTSVLISLIGPRVGEAFDASGYPRPAPYGSMPAVFDGIPMRVLGHDGFSPDGCSVLTPPECAGGVWKALLLAAGRVDGCPAGSDALESRRILRGIPAAGHELTEDYNPLEAGQLDAVSFDKGCYVGQEVVARLRTYDKISRVLLGVRFGADSVTPQPGDALFFDGKEVGRVTSAATPPGHDRPLALAYVKHRSAGAGDTVRVGAADGSIVGRLEQLPFGSNTDED
ncbi:MAG: aminomethyl transferase family protein [bacterium]|nr:aminomethyl transferase family protein [bacterium]